MLEPARAKKHYECCRAARGRAEPKRTKKKSEPDSRLVRPTCFAPQQLGLWSTTKGPKIASKKKKKISIDIFNLA